VNLAKDRKICVRFIELMPIGFGKSFPGIPHSEFIPELKRCYPGMSRDSKQYGNGPALYYSIPDFMGRIGFISAICENFCEHCNRLRLTTDGFMKSCLCYNQGVDLKTILRREGTDDTSNRALREGIASAILCKPKSHSFLSEDKISEKKTMSAIGG
jgi:cyclic pyranopterin phosphate synthase